MTTARQPVDPPLVGLLPAAGSANRLAPLPCSKEIYPVGFRATDGAGDRPALRPKVACHYLLERMVTAGVGRAYIVLGDGKWDIPAYLGDGAVAGVDIAYLTLRRSPGVPYTVDRAHRFVADSRVAFGFPDIIFEPADAFSALLEHQDASAAPVVLGLFPTDQPDKMDMVELAGSRVRRVVVKPGRSRLRHTWIIAVWTHEFSGFLHGLLGSAEPARGRAPAELHLGHVLQAAIDSGLRVDGVVFGAGTYRDIGTPEDLAAAVREADWGPPRPMPR